MIKKVYHVVGVYHAGKFYLLHTAQVVFLLYSLQAQLGRTRVETRLGQPGHVLSGSSWSNPVYKISGSYLDSALNHMC